MFDKNVMFCYNNTKNEVVTLYNNKFTQKLLKEFLKQGGKIIRSNNSVSNREKLKIINIFSLLLDEKYSNVQDFEKMIRKIENKKVVSAKKIVQLLYDYIIYKKYQLKDTIENYINNLKQKSRFYSIKNHLLKKVREINDIINIKQNAKYEELKENIDKIVLQDNDINSVTNALIAISNNLPISIIKLSEDHLLNFFDDLKEKLNNICKKIVYENLDGTNKQVLNKAIKQVSSKIKLISSQIDNPKDELINSIKGCLKVCKQVRTLSSDINNQLKRAVKKSNDKAYNLKAFKVVYDNNFKILEEANNQLKKINSEAQKTENKDFDGLQVDINSLSSYKNILDNKDVRMFNEKFFGKSISEMKKVVEGELNKITKKSMFGNSTPTNRQIFDKLYNVMYSVRKKADHREKKSEEELNQIKEQLAQCSIENIRDACPSENWDNKLEKSVNKILIHRDISKLNYKNLYNIVANNNKTAWKKLEGNVKVKGKKVIDATLSSTPACDFNIFKHLDSGQGINSNQRDAEHAINLWKTEAKTKDGKVLFSALRHGNTRGKEQSTKEIILAAAYQQYGERLLKLEEGKSKENPIKVKLGNIQLMSPAKGITSVISVDKEMPFKQMDKFKEYVGKPFEIEIKDNNTSIWLKLEKSILVNFGTNTLHYALNGALVSSSDKQNEEAFKTLFGKKLMDFASEKYNKNKGECRWNDFIFKIDDFEDGEIFEWFKNYKNKDTKDYKDKEKKIVNLSSQILYLWYSTNKRGKSSNPAAIQTRLAALMYLIGYPVSFNCKSGKDRTGEVAAEINDLVLTMEANEGEVPDPDADLKDEDKLQARNVLDATQSDVIAQTNTGIRGLKIGHKGTTERFGGNLKGASKNAKN